MIILGFDPGTQTTGYGVLELDAGNHVFHRGHGVIDTKKRAGATEETRMVRLREQVREICKRFQPDAVAAEDVFVGVNRKSAITLAHYRGILVEACAEEGHRVVSFKPTAVKKVAAGTGKASKEDVQTAIQKTLRLNELPSPDHAADALAVCLTYLDHELSLVI